MKWLVKRLSVTLAAIGGSCVCMGLLAAQVPTRPPTPPVAEPPAKKKPAAVEQPPQLPPMAPKGAVPARPSPGTGTPATPATPLNPNANPNTQGTPPRTDLPATRPDRFRNNPVLKQNTTGTSSSQTGTTTTPGTNTTSTSTSTSGPSNVNSSTMIRGLVNITNITNINIQPGNIVNINTRMNPTQVQALMQSLASNQMAQTNAQALTTRLQQQGLLQPGQSVMGFNDGQVFVGSSGAGTQGSNASAPSAGTQGGSASAPSAATMIQGLASLNAANVNVQASNVVKVQNALGTTQLQNLIQSLGTNSQAQTNAQALTRRLQQQGLLQASQRVVGFANGEVFITGP